MAFLGRRRPAPAEPGDRSDRAVRTARLVDDGWVLPWGLGRQVDQGSVAFVPQLAGEGITNRTGRRWTSVGPAGGPAATVDPAGLVTPRLGGWSVDWWVGADDRWRLPSREPAVRQALAGSAPVVETALRIPSGDAVHRAYGIPGFVVIEVENRSPSPFALAFVLRPYDPLGATAIGSVAIEGGEVRVDGRTALVLPGEPGRVAASVGSTGDVAEAVLGGRAGATAHAVTCPDRLASAAVLVPVAHRTSIRVLIPQPGAGSAPARLPSADAVVRGWQAQARTGLRVEVPDPRLQRAFDAARLSLLVQGGDRSAPAEEAAAVVAALGRLGRHAEVDALVRAPSSGQRTDGRIDEPAGPDAPGGAHLSARGEPIRRRRAGRGGPVSPAHPAVPGPAGFDVVATLAVAAAEVAAGDARALDRLAWVLGVGEPTWSWPDHVHPRTGAGSDGRGSSPLASAAFLLMVCDLLVTEPAPGHAALLPLLPDSWRGQPVDVHDAALSGGVRLSFAVRWHGHRPALLWEASGPVRLTAPGLDPSFATSDGRGEVLLGSPATPTAAGGGTVELS